MSLLKHVSSALSRASGRPQLHVPFFKRIVRALLGAPPSTRIAGAAGTGMLAGDVRDLFAKTWLNVHDDVRWFFLRDCWCVPRVFWMPRPERAHR
jgi:U3 small nucleolar RNA-associated protein 19